MTETCSCPPEAGSATCDSHGHRSVSSCPAYLNTGKLLDSITLKALLNIPLTEICCVGYRFCSLPDCPVVYYSQDGAQTFLEIHLRERVYQKHVTEDDVLIYYCFRHKTGSIKAEYFNKQAAIVVARINAGIQASQCACDIRNSQGSCCLGNVRVFVSNLEAYPS